ncbi:MAG TPA: methyltransferase domain-containing protein [Candidatus Binataceae bacterium]|nr:methyltransferase domain-containing protein [Candidatus Binataceae bacterium]
MVSSQTWDPQTYARNARFVSDLAGAVLELLAARAGERILDLGCGDGVLTAKLAAAGCEMVGVDGSAAQVEATRALGLDARVMDGERLEFDAEFDAVFSNAALHWMRRPDAVIRGVWRALKPGGRFVAEMGGFGCVAKIKTALVEAMARRGIDGEALNPWYFPTVDDYSARLRAGGFKVEDAVLVPRPTALPGDIAGWLATFAQIFTAALAPQQRPVFIAEVKAALEPQLCDAQGQWWADYVRLRFRATKVS